MQAILDFFRKIKGIVTHSVKAHQIVTAAGVTSVARLAILRETAEAIRRGMTQEDQLVLIDRLADLGSRELRQRTAEMTLRMQDIL